MAKRTCIFCQSNGLTNEHVVAQSLISCAELEQCQIVRAHFHETNGLKELKAIIPDSFKTKKVCAACNNGWMSQLENKSLELLGPLVKRDFPILFESYFSLLSPSVNDLIRWMLKSAIVVEHATPRMEIPVVHADLYDMAIGEKAIGQNFHLFAGKISEPSLSARLTKGMPTWNGRQLHRNSLHIKGLSFSLQINHLILRLIHIPDASFHYLENAPHPTGKMQIPMAVPPPGYWPGPVTHEFASLQAFDDAIEINADNREGHLS